MNADNIQWFLLGAAVAGALWAARRVMRSPSSNFEESTFGRPEHAHELSRHPLRKTQERPRQTAQPKPGPPAEIQPPTFDAPYDLDKRPMPEGDDTDRLLPRQIGRFRRGELRGDVYRVMNVEYSDGRTEICMTQCIYNSPESARKTIGPSMLESADFTESIEASSIGTEPSFLKSRINNARMGEAGKLTLIAWNRGPYYFQAEARSGELLDQFMEDFPY